jgi:putative transposase
VDAHASISVPSKAARGCDFKLAMWAPATRGRMAVIAKKTKRYPTNLTHEEWSRIQPFLAGGAKTGRRVETDLREVLNAIRYMARSGGGWRMLPKDFPP